MISRVDRAVAAVLALRVARMDVDHRSARLVAARRRLADLGGLLRDDRALAILLHAAVDRDRDDDLVSGEHSVLSRSLSWSGNLARGAAASVLSRQDSRRVVARPGSFIIVAMKLATLRDHSRDGQLVVVSRDLRRAVQRHARRETCWRRSSRGSQSRRASALADELERGRVARRVRFRRRPASRRRCRAPGNGSTDRRSTATASSCSARSSTSHIDGTRTQPLMYQGGSDDFLGPGKTCRCPPKPTASTSKPRSPSSSIACRWAPGRRRARAREARDAGERCEPARARGRRR